MNQSAKITTGIFMALGLGVLAAAPANAATADAGPGGPGTANAEYQVNQHATWSPHRIAVLQESLNSTGANLKVDGTWGPATEAALRTYQKQNGLKITGTLDTATMARLDPIG